MAEGSDALLDRLNRVMKDEFDANMLGRVGRGQLAEVKFLKLRWHEQEMCFRWSGGTRYVTEVAVLLGLTDTRAVTKTRTLGTKATGGGARDALERLDTFQAVTFRSAVGLIGDIVLDRPDCQYAAKTVRSATGEPAKLDWMRKMRLAKFLVPHSELEWLCQVQDVPGVRRRRLGGLGNSQPEHSNSLDTSHRNQLLDPARHRSLSSGEAELCATGRAAAGGLQSVQLLAEAGMNLFDEECLKVLMIFWRDCDTPEDTGDAVSMASEGQTAAVIAVRSSQPIDVDKNVMKL